MSKDITVWICSHPSGVMNAKALAIFENKCVQFVYIDLLDCGATHQHVEVCNMKYIIVLTVPETVAVSVLSVTT